MDFVAEAEESADLIEIRFKEEPDDETNDVEVEGIFDNTLILENYDYNQFTEEIGSNYAQDESDEEKEVIAELIVDPEPVQFQFIVESPKKVTASKHYVFRLSPNSDLADPDWLYTPKPKRAATKHRIYDPSDFASNERNYYKRKIVKSGKPRLTYTRLIELVLEDNGPSTVSEIYKWISDRYPYFDPEDDKWKNSIRHTLSINPNFRKTGKSLRGNGNCWMMLQKNKDPFINSNENISDDKKDLSLDEKVAEIVANIFRQHPDEILIKYNSI